MKEEHNVVKNMAELTYLGSLRTQAKHLRSGTQIVTDAPVDNNGKGEAFSPTDLVATGLAACMVTIMGITAEKRGLEMPKTQTWVRKIMTDNPRRISRIEVDIEFSESQLTPDQIKFLEKVALTCPVAKSLHSEIEQVVTFM